MKLHWKESLSATSLHAAACMREGLPITDELLAATLIGPAEQFFSEIETCGMAVEELLPTLLALAAQIDNNRQLIETAFTRIRGRALVAETSITRLAGALSDLEAELARARPRLGEELPARGRPLRELWEGRGPGLLRQTAELGEQLLIAPEATVVLVAPVVGGHGRAHLLGNRVTFEAVLANAMAELPETLRLAWLLAQLNLDLPVFSEHLPAGRLPAVAPLAALPLVLAAAESVELAQLDQPTLKLALECWHLPADLPSDLTERLMNWWQTYQEGSTRWTVALTALDAMLTR